MITVANRVAHAIDSMARKEFEYALEDAAIAIDISSQRHSGKQKSSRSDYKAFLHEYYWLIELMALGGIDVQQSVFSNITIPGVSAPKMPDLLYHIVRCGLVHSTGLPQNLVFVPGRVAEFSHEFTRLPEQMLWGLLATVVFSKVNVGEVSDGDYFLSYEAQKFLVKDHWGREDIMRKVYDQASMPRVALNITPFAQP